MLNAGAIFTVTTGEGRSRYRVLDVRRPSDPMPRRCQLEPGGWLARSTAPQFTQGMPFFAATGPPCGPVLGITTGGDVCLAPGFTRDAGAGERGEG